MFFRFFPALLLALSAVAGGTLAAVADGDRDRPVILGSVPNTPAANNDSVWMDLGYPVKTSPGRRATQLDVNRLKKLRTRPSVKCAKIEYVYQCLSNQNMSLKRTRCRAGQTEASCCKGVRTYVNSNICGPIWNRYKQAGKTYYPGVWLCKCIEPARTIRKLRKRPIRPRH